MKPQTKLHHEVFAVSQKLSPLTESEKTLAIKRLFPQYGTTSRKTIFCLECTHSWKDNNAFSEMHKGLVCPSCNAKIQIFAPKTRFTASGYFAKIDAKDNFQIERIFYIEKFMQKDETPSYRTTEVIQHYIGLNGRITSMAMPVHGMVMYYDSWIFGKEMSIMPNNFLNSNRGKIYSNCRLPKPKLLKEVTRNGFRGKFYGMVPKDLFSILLRSQHAETLIKTNQTDLLANFISRESQIKENWKSIKICIRNNYKIKDATMWLDYVKLLNEFGRDLLNPKYVCPDNLKKAHDKYMDKKRRINAKLKAEELKKQLKSQQKAYKKEKAKYFGISFSNGNITVKVLDSVKVILVEGETLKHCVYTNKYFEEENSLLLSARIDDKPIETIELSLTEMKIVQARGLQNKATKYNKEIKKLVMDNIHQIQKITNLKST